MFDSTSPAKTRHRDLLRSMTRWPWTMMVGSVRLGSSALWTPATAVAPRGAVEGMVREAKSRFDEALGAVSSAGDRLGEAAVDWAFETSEQQFDVQRWTPLALGLLEDTSRAAGSAMWPQGEIPWIELRNKLEAFRLFEDETGLAPAVGEAAFSGDDPYSSLWAMEGLGHRHAEDAWEQGHEPHGLLSHEAHPELPAGSLVPLHAGLGLSLASRCLAAFPEPLSDEDLIQAVDRFLELSQANSRRGHSQMAVEALGLVVRNLYPELMPRLHDLLRERQQRWADCFWHGVGRGLYFAPTQAMPFTASWRRALDQLRRQAPDERARRNALAGYGWALTLVNIRQRQVLVDFVSCHGDELSDDDAFTHGVISAVLVWTAWAGREGHFEALLSGTPDSPLWQKLVLDPSLAAIGQQEGLVRSDRMAALFRYLPLAELGLADNADEERSGSLP